MNQKMMRDLQNQMLKIQDQLAEETVQASAAGGAITAVMTGQQQLQSVKIDPEAIDPDDLESLEDMVVAVVNEAIQKSQELAATRMGALTGGMKIPGL